MAPEWVPRDVLFMTTDEAAQMLRVQPRTIVNLIARKELGAIRVGSDYRIPRPALDAYQRRQATSPEAVQHLSAIATPSIGELRQRLEMYERSLNMTTPEFLRAYHESPDDRRWQSAHHRWAALAEALEAVSSA